MYNVRINSGVAEVVSRITSTDGGSFVSGTWMQQTRRVSASIFLEYMCLIHLSEKPQFERQEMLMPT